LSLVRYHRIVRTRPARGSGICNTPLCTRQPIRHGLNSCQFLAPTTYVYTSPEKRGQALLEWGCQGMQRVEADTDQPSASPPCTLPEASGPTHSPVSASGSSAPDSATAYSPGAEEARGGRRAGLAAALPTYAADVCQAPTPVYPGKRSLQSWRDRHRHPRPPWAPARAPWCAGRQSGSPLSLGEDASPPGAWPAR